MSDASHDRPIGDNLPSAIPPRALALVVTRGVSSFGASMTGFALNVWVFRQTGSYADFVWLTLLSAIPNLLLAPFIGIVVDRVDKRHLLIGCEFASLLAVSAALWNFLAGTLGIAAAGATVLLLSIASNFRWTLMGATVGAIVPRGALGRINGVQQSLAGASDMLAPLLGVAVMQQFGCGAVFAIHMVTTLVAIGGLSALSGIDLRPHDPARPALRFLHEATYGMRWIARQLPLRRLLAFVVCYNFAGAVFTVTFVPYVLSFASERTLSAALALEGAGAFAVGLAIARYRGTLDAEKSVYCAAAAFGVLLVAWGTRRSGIDAIAFATCSGMLTSFIVVSLQTAWQRSVPPEIQGKVFATRRMVANASIPVAVLASVPFATHGFAPLLHSDGLASKVWGSGQTGALGMMLTTLGVVLAAAGIAMAGRRRLFTARNAPPTVPVSSNESP